MHKLMIAAVMLLSAITLPITAETVEDPSWGFSFPLPAGWKVQKDSGGAVLGHDSIAGLIIVFPHGAASLQQMREEMGQGIAEGEVQLRIVGGLQPFGKNALAGGCEGYFGGEQVKGKTLGALSPSGGGAYVIAISTPTMYGQELAAAADQIVKGMQFPKGLASDLLRVFAGTWTTMSTHSQSCVTLRPNGEFSLYSESSYSGGFSAQYGSDLGGWGSGGRQESRGRWSASGTRERGVITLIYQDGERASIPYNVHVEGGETYWNEYYFDGTLYGRSR